MFPLRQLLIRPSSLQCSICRHFSSTRQIQESLDPQAIAEAFRFKFKGQSFVRKQLLDANQLRLFSLTLNRPHLWPGSSLLSKSLEDDEPVQGTPVPPGYHLAYFTPTQLPGILGIDGTDASFNPEPPFTRRMWAGGSVMWPGADPSKPSNNFLQVGDRAIEITKVLSCEAKTIKKTGDSMLVIGVEKEFRDSKENLCVVDRRNWIFREALDPSKPVNVPSKPTGITLEELDKQTNDKIVTQFNRDAVILFRFSALTFNGHRIHYDKVWAENVEGHRNIVVHGPLNLVSMLDIWRDEAVRKGVAKARDQIMYPAKIEYRATSPLYAQEPYRILMNKDAISRKRAELLVQSNDGTDCMKGAITGW